VLDYYYAYLQNTARQQGDNNFSMAITKISVKVAAIEEINEVTHRLGWCELSALWSHFVSGVMAPVNVRRNGATLFPA
jgi:hypothetical protein